MKKILVIIWYKGFFPLRGKFKMSGACDFNNIDIKIENQIHLMLKNMCKISARKYMYKMNFILIYR